MVGPNRAEAPGDHHRLVVAAHHLGIARIRLLKGAEVAAEARTTVLIVEGRRAYGAFQHDVERRGHRLRLAGADFPGFRAVGDVQVGGGEPGQPCLGLGASAHRALIPNLAAAAGGCPRIGRDAGGMVVGLHLHQHRRILFHVEVLMRAGIGHPTLIARAGDHCRVVGIGA